MIRFPENCLSFITLEVILFPANSTYCIYAPKRICDGSFPMSRIPATVGQSCAGSNNFKDANCCLIPRLSPFNMLALTILGRYSDLNRSRSKSSMVVCKHGVVSNVCDFTSLFSRRILNSSSFASPRLGPIRIYTVPLYFTGVLLLGFTSTTAISPSGNENFSTINAG